MHFRIWTIFYVFALVAAALATFGVWGLLWTGLELGFWAWEIYVPKPAYVWEWLFLIVIIAILFTVLFLPPNTNVRTRTYSASCLNNLRQVTQAALNFQQREGAFPSAYSAKADGTATLSWRALLLPRIDRSDVFEWLDFEKSWDDPVHDNIRPIEVYCCPLHVSDKPTTSYFAVVGTRTAWPGAKGRRLDEFSDRPEETILLIESHAREVNWAEPRDLSFEEAVGLLTKAVPANDGHPIKKGFFYKTGYARCVAFADGRVQYFYGPMSRELAVALLTIDGGEIIDLGVLDQSFQPELDYGKCYAFGLFVVLSLLPAMRVRRRRALGN
jgi:hypothetical protein